VQHPAGHRVRGRQPGEPVGRKRLRARDQHQVPEPAAAQHRRVGDEAHLTEDGPGRAHLRPGVRQRRAVGHVGREDPGLAQHPPGRGHELHRGQVGRCTPAREHVRDHHIVGTGPQALEHRPGVPDPDPDPGPRQPLPDQVHQRGVDLDGQLPRARPGRRHVTGQGEGARAQVQHSQRLPRRRRGVDHVPQPPDVLEVQVGGVVQVDVRLRDAVDQQHPRRPPVSVPQQLSVPVDTLHAVGRVLNGPPSHTVSIVGITDVAREVRMAVEQPGTEAEPDPTQLADAAGQGDDAAPSAEAEFDDLKRKFREALDRKRSAHASAEGAHDTGKVHGSHGPAVSRRSFRRKSGG
jgi:hypothetical protein